MSKKEEDELVFVLLAVKKADITKKGFSNAAVIQCEIDKATVNGSKVLKMLDESLVKSKKNGGKVDEYVIEQLKETLDVCIECFSDSVEEEYYEEEGEEFVQDIDVLWKNKDKESED